MLRTRRHLDAEAQEATSNWLSDDSTHTAAFREGPTERVVDGTSKQLLSHRSHIGLVL